VASVAVGDYHRRCVPNHRAGSKTAGAYAWLGLTSGAADDGVGIGRRLF
jgi:hypothetical protein